ncbi:MAG: hypothetical protein OEV00_07515, partial [Acidobacteriota bacterium]|nr:hypothetical protein [Acidobacteriota bacterium]
KSYATQLEKEMEEAVRKGADPATIPNSDQLEQIKNMILLAEDRLAEAERRVIEAEDDLTKRRRQIDILDEQLETLFEGLDTGR